MFLEALDTLVRQGHQVLLDSLAPRVPLGQSDHLDRWELLGPPGSRVAQDRAVVPDSQDQLVEPVHRDQPVRVGHRVNRGLPAKWGKLAHQGRPEQRDTLARPVPLVPLVHRVPLERLEVPEVRDQPDQLELSEQVASRERLEVLEALVSQDSQVAPDHPASLAAKVHRGPPDQQDRLATLDRPDLVARRELLAIPDLWDRLGLVGHRVDLEQLVPVDHWASKVPPDLPVQLVELDTQDNLDSQEALVLPDLLVRLGQLVSLVTGASRACKGLQGLLGLLGLLEALEVVELPELLDLKVRVASLGLKAQRVLLAPRGLPDQLAPSEVRVFREQLGPLVAQAHLGLLDLPEIRELEEQQAR